MRIRYKTFPWIRPVADDLIKNFIIANGKPRRFVKNDIVVQANETYPYFSLIMSGMLAKGFNLIDTKKDFSHSLMLPGSTVGDFYLMTNSVCNLKIIAIRESVLFEVPHAVVHDYMCANLSFMKVILNQLMLNTASDSEGLATITARSAEERLRVLLKVLLVRCKVKATDCWYKLPIALSHKEYARVIYSTPLTVNRLLVQFHKDGLFEKRKADKFVHRDLLNNIYDWYPEDPEIQLG